MSPKSVWHHPSFSQILKKKRKKLNQFSPCSPKSKPRMKAQRLISKAPKAQLLKDAPKHEVPKVR